MQNFLHVFTSPSVDPKSINYGFSVFCIQPNPKIQSLWHHVQECESMQIKPEEIAHMNLCDLTAVAKYSGVYLLL